MKGSGLGYIRIRVRGRAIAHRDRTHLRSRRHREGGRPKSCRYVIRTGNSRWPRCGCSDGHPLPPGRGPRRNHGHVHVHLNCMKCECPCGQAVVARRPARAAAEGPVPGPSLSASPPWNRPTARGIPMAHAGRKASNFKNVTAARLCRFVSILDFIPDTFSY